MPEMLCTVCKKKINTRGMTAHVRAHERRGETAETFRMAGKSSNHKGVHTEDLPLHDATLSGLSYTACPHCEGVLVLQEKSIRHVGRLTDLMDMIFKASDPEGLMPSV